MIRDFSDISVDEIKYLVSHPITLCEKLDAIYFKVEITSTITIPLKTPRFNAVSDVDCMINSIYKNISDFTYKEIYRISKELTGKYGNIRIGFFYLPVGKTKHIDYSESNIYKYRRNFRTGWLGLSDVYFYDNVSRRKYTIWDIYDDLFALGITVDKPCIIYENRFIGTASEETVFALKTDPIAAAAFFTTISNESTIPTTYSGLPVDKIEGYIIKCGGKQWQIRINSAEPHINKDTKKIYRDMVLGSLVRDLLDVTDIINIVHNMKCQYEDKVAYVFEEFINKTDIFSRVLIEPEDLLPPVDGYIGEMCIDSLQSDNVKTICKYDKTLANILRMFLHTFTNTIYANKFSDLPEHDRIKMNELIISLKYRNYADIALRLAKK